MLPRTTERPSVYIDPSGRNYGPDPIRKERIARRVRRGLVAVSLGTLAFVIANEEIGKVPFEQQVAEEIKKDGFEAEVDPYNLNKVNLKIGSSCVVRDVKITIDQRGNDVSDVAHYELTLNTPPQSEITQLQFENREDLGEQVNPVDICLNPDVLQAAR